MSSDVRSDRSGSASGPILFLAGTLGVFLQIQESFHLPGVGAKGLRLNLADLILPMVGAGVLRSLVARRSYLPRWRMPFGYAWLGALTLVLGLALAHGFLLYGHVNDWAVTNKFAGWFVLLAYFGLGGWLVANYGDTPRRAFLTCFTGAFIVILTILLALTAAGVYSPLWGTYPRMIELRGFMGNRNAYAFLAMAILIFATTCLPEGALSRYFRFGSSILWFLLPLTLYYNASRTFLVTATFFLLVLAAWRFRNTIKYILPPLLVGVLLCGIIHHIHPRPVAVAGQTEQALKIVRALSADPAALTKARKIAQPNTSEAVRLRVLQDAIELWRTHPLTGTGLGSFWDFSQKKYAGTDKIIEIIDCTPLWLFTEAGLVGLAVFGAFFACALSSLSKGIRESEGEDRAFLQSAILLLACFALMSLFQELLYTRFLWFVLGMALARPTSVTD